MAIGLTERQKMVLAYISAYIAANGIAPTVSEIAQAHAIHFASAYAAVDELVRKGYLKREPAAGIAVVG